MSKHCSETKADLDKINQSLIATSDKTDYLDGQSRRHNIVVGGIKETGKEKVSDSEEKVRKLFSEKLKLDHLKIELDWAHWTGEPLSSEKPRPIVVRFSSSNDGSSRER